MGFVLFRVPARYGARRINVTVEFWIQQGLVRGTILGVSFVSCRFTE